LPLLSNDPVSLEAVLADAAIRWDTPLMIASRVALSKDTLVVPGRVGGTAVIPEAAEPLGVFSMPGLWVFGKKKEWQRLGAQSTAEHVLNVGLNDCAYVRLWPWGPPPFNYLYSDLALSCWACRTCSFMLTPFNFQLNSMENSTVML